MILFVICFLFLNTAHASTRTHYLLATPSQKCRKELDPASAALSSLPLIYADDAPLFDHAKLTRLRRLFDQLDAGEVGFLGYGGGQGIQLRKTPYIHLVFRYESGQVLGLEQVIPSDPKIGQIYQTDFATPGDERIPVEFLGSVLKDIMERMIAVSPQHRDFLEGGLRGAAISFLRYDLTPRKWYPGFPWHQDYGSLQAITPISLPAGLQGAHLQLMHKPSLPKRNVIVDVTPQVNRTVIFDNSEAWHQVTPFKLLVAERTTAKAKTKFRDIFTVEIHDHPGQFRNGRFR